MSEIMTNLIKDRFNKMFEKQNKRKHYERSRGGVHASSLIMPSGSWCPREQIINYFKEADDYHYLPAKVIRRMVNGNSVHKKWQDLFKASGVSICSEQQFVNECVITGTPDSIINLDNTKYIVEIKSTNDKSFSSMTKLPVGTKRQIMYYMYLTGIPNGIVIYENTNDSDFEIYLVEYDIEFVKEYVVRQYEIKDGIKIYYNENRLPPKHARCTSDSTGRANSCACTELCFNTAKLEELVNENFRN